MVAVPVFSTSCVWAEITLRQVYGHRSALFSLNHQISRGHSSFDLAVRCVRRPVVTSRCVRGGVGAWRATVCYVLNKCLAAALAV